jgi:protein-S-isoprenylcysteine O-methyltransferase Ste14
MNIVWWILYSAWVTGEVLVLVRTRTRADEGTVQDRGSLRTLWCVIVTTITFGMWIAPRFHPRLFSSSQQRLSTAILFLVIGLVLRWIAIATLGRAFSANVAILEEQAIIRDGMYRWVRHPSYTGLLLIFAGIGAYTGTWAGLAIVCIPGTAALLYRIHVEEIALREAFGPLYVEYARETKRLIPWVY